MEPAGLDFLKTDLGERSLYDSVSQCSRCGYCLQACPTYVLTGREALSGRGRNQIVRMLLEGKLKKATGVEEALATCLLCGGCTSACYAHVPTSDLVLEGRRRMHSPGKSSLRHLVRLLSRRPLWFACLLRAAHLIKRSGLARLAALAGLFRVMGWNGLEVAQAQVQEAPLKFLFEHLKKSEAVASSGSVRWLYFTCCGPNYLYPRVGLATVRLLRRFHGEGRFLKNGCCGLIAYNYGDLDSARDLARRNIEAFERESPGGEKPYAIGDCSSCAAHLKIYEQLFLEELEWKARAWGFSRHVRDVIEMIPIEKIANCGLRPPAGRRAGITNSKSAIGNQKSEIPIVTYHDSCRARNAQGLISQPRSVLQALAGARYVELPESDWCCGGAGTYAFTQPRLSDQVLRRKISNIAGTGAQLVVTSSTSCLIQIAHGLEKYYPDCRVMHLSEFVQTQVDRICMVPAGPSLRPALEATMRHAERT